MIEELTGTARLAQEQRPEQRTALLEALWARGLPGDPAAIERIRDANPDTPSPAFLAAPDGASLVCALDEREVEGAVALLEGEYWNVDLGRELIASAQLGATAWVGARDDAGRLIANARAISDGVKYAWIYDVAVSETWRGRGLGAAVMRLLLDHPALRRVRGVWLDTRDAQTFYRRFGFVDRDEARRYPWSSSSMVLRRA